MGKSGKPPRGTASCEPRAEELDHFHRLIDLMTARVHSVAKRYQTGAYIVGRPGSGKTHTIRRVLDAAAADHVLLNGRITPAALFEQIALRLNSIIVIDDVPALFDSIAACQILMAAIGGDPGKSRRITYVTKKDPRAVEFTGGVIAISNRPLNQDPIGIALASRMTMLEHEPSDEMLIAFMSAEARKGVKGLSPKECKMVLDYIVTECRAGDYRIDLRYFYKGLDDYRCWKHEECDAPWRMLIKSSMRSVTAQELPASPATRAETKASEQEIVRELHARGLDAASLETEWKDRTGKSIDTYYRHRRAMRLR